MKKTIITILAIFALLAVGCSQQAPPIEPIDNGMKACTEEAKMCPDGSAVGRNGSKNCEFDECTNVQEPSEQTATEPDTKDRRYVQTNYETCLATDWICPNMTEQFLDQTGCGCQAIDAKSYTSTDTELCTTMLFMCAAPSVPFFDDAGCGCGFAWPEEFQEAPSTGGKIKAFDCTEPRPEACTREYMPVCGQMQVECITTPCNPVKETFSNKCEACANERVLSYTMGECGSEIK